MASKKRCLSCGNEAPIAQKVCSCGVYFVKGKKFCSRGDLLSTYKSLNCNNAMDKGISECQEPSNHLNDKLLVPTRPVRMKQSALDDDIIYKESLVSLRKQNNRFEDNSDVVDLEYLSDKNRFYSKDLDEKDMERESELGNLSTLSKKIEKMYPKRERQKSTKYQEYESIMEKKAVCLSVNRWHKKSVKENNSLNKNKKDIQVVDWYKKMKCSKNLMDSKSVNNKDKNIQNFQEESCIAEFKSDMSKVNVEQLTDLESDLSDDEKTLKELKKKISHSLKHGESSMTQTIKKKLGRPRIHPTLPKKPVGRPRKFGTNVPQKYCKKEEIKIENEGKIIPSFEKCFKQSVKIQDTLTKSYERKGIKRGRPKGCKDSKPRKIKTEQVSKIFENGNSKKKISLLSPPSLILSLEEKNKDNDLLNPEEIEKIERRLNKTNPFIIPETKKDLFASILVEINRRISAQSFQSLCL